MKIVLLGNFPGSMDFALLALRLWAGGSMLVLHGAAKLTHWGAMADQFPDPLGVGRTASLLLAVFGEVVCSGLLVLGLFTRLAALYLGITMGVAFWLVHGHKLTGEGSGELAFIYLGAFVALFLAGAGRYSLDTKLAPKG